MMDWRDEALVLSLRPHGEAAALVEIFSQHHGRHIGLVRGGMSRRMAPHLQPGTQVQAQWRARLGDHLGSLNIEPIRSRAYLMADRLDLAGLGAICVLLQLALPERAPDLPIWTATMALLEVLGQPDWPQAYLQWEMDLLEGLGYGLDLSSCAVTGAVQGLVLISPKTGRAVTRAGAGDWAERLLPLPEGMAVPGCLTPAALVQGLHVTGYFLAKMLTEHHGRRPLPEARGRLIDLLARRALPLN